METVFSTLFMIPSDPTHKPGPSPELVAQATSELNNLLQVIAGSTSAIEKVVKGDEAAAPYIEMLHASVDRAENVARELAKQAGGAANKVLCRPQVNSSIKARTGAPTAPNHPSILIVDDEKMALGLMDRLLVEAGYDVVAAQSGFECLDLFRRQPRRFALILLDLTLPFMDGQETFRRLREIRAEVPVVLCTGFIAQERLRDMMESGLCGFLRKPVSPEELLATVQSTLATARYAQDRLTNDELPVAG
jgi:CheY-like chemotaxis protein